MLVRIANRDALIRLLLKKQSDLGLHCLSRPFWQATSVQNLRSGKACTVNDLKLRTLINFCIQINVGFQGWNSQNACQNSKQG